MKQPYNGGIRVISGSKMIYQDDAIIKITADRAYAELKKLNKHNLLEDAKREFKNKVGQSIVRDTLHLGDDSYMEIELIPNGINLKYVVTGNKFRFWVTTPDINVLGLGIGASRHVDPGFEIHFDLSIEMQAINVHSIDTIRLSQLSFEANIDFEGTNITGKIAVAVVKVIDKAIAWIKNEDGFLKSLERYSKELIPIKDKINELMETIVIQNQRLLEEMGIDETHEIHYGLSNDLLTLTHPHSSTGSMKRIATETVADHMDNKISTGAYSPGSTSVSGGISAGPKSIRRG